MRLLLVIMSLALVLGACTAEKSGKTELTSFVSSDGTRKCEAWKESGKYRALCVSTAGPEMFLRAAEEHGSPTAVTRCFDGRQGSAWYVSCSSTESLADFIK